MIFVLFFVLLVGFLVYKTTYKTGFLKTKNKFKMARIPEVKRFWDCKLFLFNEESKMLLKHYGKATTKNVDSILSKVRLNCPKENLLEKEKKFFYNVLQSKPVYIVKDKKELPAIEIALRLEEFFALEVDNNQKQSQNFYTDKLNFINPKNKKLFEMLEKLNINLQLPNNLKTIFLPENLTPKGDLKKSSILYENYLLEKYQNNDIDFFVYRFFVGQCLTFVLIKNKTMQTKTIEFKYFHDFANKKNNYYEFVKKQNFVLIKNLKTETITYFNFSHVPKSIKTSAVIGLEKSNLPCVLLDYKMELPPNAVNQTSFMFSQTPQPLALLNFKNFINFGDKLQEVFFFEIDFLSETENKFFSQVLNRAKVTLLKKSQLFFYWHEGTYATLKQKFLKKEMDALCFYLSVQNNLMSIQKGNIKINPYFLESNFVINFKDSQSIYVLKQDLKVPYLVLDGVKYYNHFTIPLQFLKKKPAKIHI